MQQARLPSRTSDYQRSTINKLALYVTSFLLHRRLRLKHSDGVA